MQNRVITTHTDEIKQPDINKLQIHAQEDRWKRLTATQAGKHQPLCATNIKVGDQNTP